MTSFQRVLTALEGKEPDRVPLMLMLSLHGAREMDLGIREYFARPEQVAEAQLRMRAKYGHDCLYGLFYTPVEVEAWGGEVIFRDDGPPNSGEPMLATPEEILALEPPRVEEIQCLLKVLRAIEIMKARCEDAPIIGVALSPFSLPVMQLGFESYLVTMFERPELFERLMEVNTEFCVAWANAQLAAGAAAICYFDPISSSTIITRDMYRNMGFQVAQRTLPRINGPTATHMASGRCLPIMDDLAETGTAIIGVSGLEDLGELKQAAAGRLTLLGNLNGIDMRHWSAKKAEEEVKAAIAKAGAGGGFLLSDNHGEIPWQVPEATIAAVADAARKWGTYPLDWVEGGGPDRL